MFLSILKSIGACVAGIFVGAILSVGTDGILESTGVLPKGNLYVSVGLIIAVLLYRTVYNTLGCYVAARLAPHHPMRHAMVLGVLGFILSAVATYATRDMHIGPSWYGYTLAVLSLPSAWIGAKLYERGSMAKTVPQPVPADPTMQ